MSTTMTCRAVLAGAPSVAATAPLPGSADATHPDRELTELAELTASSSQTTV